MYANHLTTRGEILVSLLENFEKLVSRPSSDSAILQHYFWLIACLSLLPLNNDQHLISPHVVIARLIPKIYVSKRKDHERQNALMIEQILPTHTETYLEFGGENIHVGLKD